MDYLSMQFLVYLGRWIVSAGVMMIPLYFLVQFRCCSSSEYMEYIHLVLIQIVGAFVFYNIDKLIFQ